MADGTKDGERHPPRAKKLRDGRAAALLLFAAWAVGLPLAILHDRPHLSWAFFGIPDDAVFVRLQRDGVAHGAVVELLVSKHLLSREEQEAAERTSKSSCPGSAILPSEGVAATVRLRTEGVWRTGDCIGGRNAPILAGVAERIRRNTQ